MNEPLKSLPKTVKRMPLADSDANRILEQVILCCTRDSMHSQLVEYFIRQYNIFDIRDVFNRYTDNLSRHDRNEISTIVNKYKKVHNCIRQARLESLKGSTLEHYRSKVTKLDFCTKQEKLEFGIKAWSFIKDQSVDDFAKLFVQICHPINLNDKVQLREFFELVSTLKVYLEFEDDEFVKLILQYSEEFCESLSDEKFHNHTWLFAYYPFTQANLATLFNRLIGQEYIVSDDNERLYYSAPNNKFALYSDRIVNAVVPGKFNLQAMMLEYWIRHSSTQLKNYFGQQNASHILTHLTNFIEQYNPKSISNFAFIATNMSYNNIAAAIKDNAQLTPDIIMDLEVYFFLKPQFDETIKDNVSIDSFNASMLKRGIKEVLIQWDDVHFFNSYIIIRNNVNGINHEFKHCCKSSIKIASALHQEYSACKSAIPLLPLIHCATIEDSIIKILNEEQIDICVENLRNLVTRTYSSSSNTVRTEDDCAVLLSLKNDCLKYLVENKTPGYSVVTLKEKFSTNSSTTVLEDAAIFVIAENNDTLTIVYENAQIARSSYVFSVKKSSLDVAEQVIKKYFTSDLINKRQRLISDTSVFSKDCSIIAVKRVPHNDIDNWKREIQSY
jgi:hypothetical protein